jgi:hypothetical protein
MIFDTRKKDFKVLQNYDYVEVNLQHKFENVLQLDRLSYHNQYFDHIHGIKHLLIHSVLDW